MGFKRFKPYTRSRPGDTRLNFDPENQRLVYSSAAITAGGKDVTLEIILGDSHTVIRVVSKVTVFAGILPGTNFFAPGMIPQEPLFYNSKKIKVGSPIVLDPRVVIVDSQRRIVIYSPSWFMDKIDAQFTDWFQKNPRWPPIVTFDTEEFTDCRIIPGSEEEEPG